ncbi:AraC family transcriptional regulator [Enterococcus sp. HY326]|uniref:AraC family transcriptional regulator n=1 Tax=Enterococcus sp. HY326 TaxID=2971265 RepID=UPI00223F67DB|nr:AraC family transcriptional regulator [Enterococcus sp. HY326]
MQHEKIVPNKNYPFKIFKFHSKNVNRQILPHWHTSLEILCCVSGELVLTYRTQEIILKAGQVHLINSNVVHSTRTPIPSEVIVLQIPFIHIEQLTEGQYGNTILFEKNLAKDSSLFALISLIYQTYSDNTLVNRVRVQGEIYQLFSLLLENYQLPMASVKEISTQKNLRKITEVHHYIAAHANESLKLTEVAEHFNYNPAYFSRYFKKFVGITFVSYLKSIRLDFAFPLLVETDLPILDIANECGFGNVKSFYLAFKEAYGMSPQQYRLSHQR